MDDKSNKQVIQEVSNSMNSKGYDSVTQIVGYLMTNDLGYIPEFDDNRNKMAKIDRTIILEELVREYLK